MGGRAHSRPSTRMEVPLAGVMSKLFQIVLNGIISVLFCSFQTYMMHDMKLLSLVLWVFMTVTRSRNPKSHLYCIPTRSVWQILLSFYGTREKVCQMNFHSLYFSHFRDFSRRIMHHPCWVQYDKHWSLTWFIFSQWSQILLIEGYVIVELSVPSARFTLHSTKLCTKFKIFRKRIFFVTKITSEKILSISQNLKVTRLQGCTQTKL